MSLVRTSLWNGVAVSIKFVSALAINKILALFVGPAGYALVGQFQNAMAIVVTFSTGAVNNGVTKHTAEHFDDIDRQRRIWQTTGTLVIGASICMALLIVLFSAQLAMLFLHSLEYRPVFVWLAISLIFISLNGFLLAILNGMKDVRRYVISNIWGSIFGLAIIGVMSWQLGLTGALVGLSVSQAVVFFVTAAQIRSASWFRLEDMFGAIDGVELNRLGKFALMAATTAIVGPVSLILIRNHLITQFGIVYAGYWDAMWRISAMYLLLVTTTLSLYYLPRIAEIRKWPELAKELKHVYALVIPPVVIASVAVYLFRNFIIPTLFDESFRPMNQLFAWQMFGDVLKIGSWILAFLMIGKGMTKAYIVTEVCASTVFYFATIVLTSHYGFQGVSMAHAATYGLYWVMVYAVTVSTDRKRQALFA